MCENWGDEGLAARSKRDSIDEMKHAESVIERIPFFGVGVDLKSQNPAALG